MRQCETRQVLFAVALLAATSVSVSLAAYQSSSSSSSSTTTTTTRILTTSVGPHNNNNNNNNGFGSANGIGASNGNSDIGGIGGIRLRLNKLRRQESCRENLPFTSDGLPDLVITGRVREVYMAPVPQSSNYSSTSVSANGQQSTVYVATQYVVSTSAPLVNKALVNINRVIKGDPQLVDSDIIISGFNSSSSTPCPNYVKPNDTYIMLLTQEGDRTYSIQGTNLLSMNLENLDRINAIATNQTFKIRGTIEDILCEKHYCAYGRCKANDFGMVFCHCPESCLPLATSVCGSDNTTYQSECHLIKEGCSRHKPLFVTKEGPC